MKINTESWHGSRGAVFEDFFGVEIPSGYGDVEQEYWHLRNDAAVRDVSYFGKVRISGKDAPMFLHRMVSNDVKSLDPGKGSWALFLDIKGHIQGDFKVYSFPDHLLMVLQHYVQDRVVRGLDRYIIGEQVCFTDVTADYAMLQVLGPQASSVLKSHGAELPSGLLEWKETHIGDFPVQVFRLGAGFALMCPVAEATGLLDRLDLPPAGMRAFDIFRIEEGMSLLNIDVDETNFPQECRMDGALNFQKGCYLGQEVMARIDAQGHVNKFLMGLLSDAPLKAGDRLYAGEKEVGRVTSTARSPRFRRNVALGYVRREFAEENRELAATDDRTTVIVRKLPLQE